jgi:hypothetical protein
MTAPQPRPRVVTAAFWCWVVAAVVLVLGGLTGLFNPHDVPGPVRAMGGLIAAAGLGLSYLAGQARRGDPRLARAAVALAFALVAVLALLAVSTMWLGWLLALVLAMVGAVLMLRPAARQWFGSPGSEGFDQEGSR